MEDLAKQFEVNIAKKIRQLAVQKMQQKMEHAAEMTMKAADKSRDFNDVTGNLYKSIGIGTYYKGNLQSIHLTPGANPTRATLAKGERYNLDKYYGSPFSFKDSGRKPYVGQYGEGGQNGPNAAEDLLLYNEHKMRSVDSTWQMFLVAGVNYANFVETKRGHDVITSLKDYLIRYFKIM